MDLLDHKIGVFPVVGRPEGPLRQVGRIAHLVERLTSTRQGRIGEQTVHVHVVADEMSAIGEVIVQHHKGALVVKLGLLERHQELGGGAVVLAADDAGAPEGAVCEVCREGVRVRLPGALEDIWDGQQHLMDRIRLLLKLHQVRFELAEPGRDGREGDVHGPVISRLARVVELVDALLNQPGLLVDLTQRPQHVVPVPIQRPRSGLLQPLHPPHQIRHVVSQSRVIQSLGLLGLQRTDGGGKALDGLHDLLHVTLPCRQPPLVFMVPRVGHIAEQRYARVEGVKLGQQGVPRGRPRAGQPKTQAQWWKHSPVR
mmetsp:Transcript_51455/g.129235  ORF Transcript_51455/g.129235 Transcript_51455/m.129235 type:complete len:313 (+) Transcript_51455:608-1546(+)